MQRHAKPRALVFTKINIQNVWNIETMGRLNGEIIAGISLAFLGILFIYAGIVNPVWAVAFLAYYVLVAVGIGIIALGIWTASNEKKHPPVEHHH